LLKLLATMTRNKLAGQVKGHGAARRDFRRLTAAQDDRDNESGAGAERIAGRGPTPSRDLAARELLEEALRRLSPDEKRILDCREHGGQWAQIAIELGSSPEAIRKRLVRAVDRVAHELGLDESN
jgi:DNA-directed RNA polymerase specialized sigma24 family protein